MDLGRFLSCRLLAQSTGPLTARWFCSVVTKSLFDPFLQPHQDRRLPP